MNRTHRISHIHLSAFGTHSNRSITFKNGINIVYGHNESGKSTIAHFLEGMLYDFVKPGMKVQRYDALLDRFRPWTGDSYKGSLTYQIDEVKYRIERDFNRHEVQMINVETLEPIRFSYPKTPGDWLLKVNRGVFSSTINQHQSSSFMDRTEVETVNDLLVNLGSSMDRGISVQRVIKDLLQQKEDIGTYRSRTKPLGLLNERLKSLSKERLSLEVRLQDSKKNRAKLRELDENLLIKRDELNTLKKEQEKLYNKLDVMRAQELADLKNQLDEISHQITNEIGESLTPSTYYRVHQLKDEIDDINSQQTRLQTQLREVESERSRERIFMTGQKLMFIRPLEIVIIAFLLYFILPFSIDLKVITAIGLALLYGTGRYVILRRKNANIRRNDLEERRSTLTYELNEQKKIKYDKSLQIDHLLQSFNIQRVEQLDGLYARQEEEKKFSLQAREIRYKIAVIEDNGRGYFPTPELRKELDDITTNIDQLSVMIRDIEFDRNTLVLQVTQEDAAKNAHTEIVEELYAIELRIKQLMMKSDALSFAISGIEKAVSVLLKNNKAQLKHHVTEGMSTITNAKYTQSLLDDELGLHVFKDGGMPVPISILSKGTMDQFLLCLRLALVKVLYTDQVFMVFDDPFSDYDDTRLKRTLKLIVEESCTRQIIIFTSQQRERRALDEIGENYHYVVL